MFLDELAIRIDEVVQVYVIGVVRVLDLDSAVRVHAYDVGNLKHSPILGSNDVCLLRLLSWRDTFGWGLLSWRDTFGWGLSWRDTFGWGLS